MIKFSGNDRGVRLLIVLLLVVFAGGALGWCSKSEAADEGLSIGFGVALAGGELCFESLQLAQAFGERKWLGYLVTHGDSPACRNEAEPIRANVGAGIVRTTHLGRWSIGFGAGVLEHGDVIVGPHDVQFQQPPRIADRMQFVATIFIRRHLGDRFVVDLLHHSTGGSTHFNRGLNTITLGVAF